MLSCSRSSHSFRGPHKSNCIKSGGGKGERRGEGGCVDRGGVCVVFGPGAI